MEQWKLANGQPSCGIPSLGFLVFHPFLSLSHNLATSNL
jgi:hypothetical protein